MKLINLSFIFLLSTLTNASNTLLVIDESLQQPRKITSITDFPKIENLGHKFPDDVKNLDCPITLLHNHSHSHGYLVFSEDFRIATYKDDISEFYPCSWFLNDKKDIIPYEFSVVKQQFHMDDIRNRLENLNLLGYTLYGTTVRPILNLVEFETDGGHIYIERDKEALARFGLPEKYLSGIVGKNLEIIRGSETAVVYDTVNRCFVRTRCDIMGGIHYHIDEYH
jgi:hypothetical protein